MGIEQRKSIWKQRQAEKVNMETQTGRESQYGNRDRCGLVSHGVDRGHWRTDTIANTMFPSFMAHDAEERMAVNNGLKHYKQSFSFLSNTSMKIVERESVKQLSTRPLYSVKQSQT